MTTDSDRHAPAPLPRFSQQRAAIEAARRSAYNLAYQEAFRHHHQTTGLDPAMAGALAHRDAVDHADRTIAAHRFLWTRGFWVSAALTVVPCLGFPLPVLFYYGWWVFRRKAALGVPAPLERINARTVIR